MTDEHAEQLPKVKEADQKIAKEIVRALYQALKNNGVLKTKSNFKEFQKSLVDLIGMLIAAGMTQERQRSRRLAQVAGTMLQILHIKNLGETVQEAADALEQWWGWDS